MDELLENSPIGGICVSKDISYLRKLEQRCDKQFALVQKLDSSISQIRLWLAFLTREKHAVEDVAVPTIPVAARGTWNCCRSFHKNT